MWKVTYTYKDKYGLVGVSLWLDEPIAEHCLCGRIRRSQNAALKKLLGYCIARHHSGSAAKSLCCFIPELQETSEQAQSKFKSEKQNRRQLELKVTALEEELTDLRAEKESLEKVSFIPEVSLLNPSGQD